MVESVVQSHAEIVVDSSAKKLIRVLHVDDELDFMKMAKECLEMQGPFKVDTANSVEEALAKLEKEQYDAVVSDYQMPGKDGLEFLEMLRKNGNTIPFIMFTGKGREEVAVKAWNLGADHYVNKTGDPETVYYELAHCLRSTVKKHFAEAQMKETVQKLQTIYQNAVEGISYVDAEEKIVYANKAFANIVGYEQDQLAGLNLHKIVDDENWIKIENETKRRRQGEISRYEVEFRRRDGTVRNVLISGAPLLDHDDRFAGTVGIVLDITEQKKTREAIKESEERLRSIVENSSDQIFMLDRDCRFLSVNKTGADLFGMSPQEMVGRSISEKFPETIAAQFSKNIKNVFDTGKSMLADEKMVVKGRELYSSTSLNPVRDDRGRVIAVTGIVRDITERKNAEKETESMAKFPAQNPEPVLRIGSDGALLYANQASQNMLEESQSKKDHTLIETLRRHAADALSSNEHSRFEAKTDGRMFQFDVVPVASEGYANLYATDMTERKKVEESVRASEERYRSYIEVTGQLGWTTNANGEVEEDVPAWRKYTGQSYEEAKGLGWTRTIHPDDLEHTVQAWEKAVAEKSSYEVEYRMRRYDGVYCYFLARGVPVLEKDGKIREWVGTCIDITERRKAEEALKESEGKFRNLAEKSPNMIFINQKGRVVYANRKAEDSMGYTGEEFCSPNFNFLDLIAEESKEVVKSSFSKHTRGDDVAPYEYKLITKEGRTIDTIINSQLIKYDGEPAILGVVTDITDRKKAERMTLASQQNFKALFMGNPEAAAHLAPDFHILDVNPRFEELFGYSLAEVKGRHINDVIVPETKSEEAEALDKNALEGIVYHNTVRKRKDGFLVPVAVSAATIMVEGNLAGCIAMYKDISELKNAEKKLEAMNEKLRVVGGLTRHDVRNKLSAITGNAYLLKKQLNDNKEVLDKLRDMETAVSQVTRIFDFAMDYEMLGVEELTYIDVQKSVNDAVQLFSDLNGVRVLNECGGLTVLSDSLLRQLFYNLIDNSLKYGEKLTQIRIYYEKSESQLKLVYEDDGVGIPKDAKTKLFTEGFTTGKGSGYGLYLIGRIMEVYGWTINETGTHGKGARFTINMPRAKPDGRQNYKLG